MTFAVSSIPSDSSLPIPGPHKLPTGWVCWKGPKDTCVHYNQRQHMIGYQQAKRWIRREQHLTRPNPYR